MKRMLPLIALLSALSTGCGPSNIGRLINTPGDYKVRGEFVRGLAVKPWTNGAERLTIRTRTGTIGADLDLREGWFIFVEPANRVWTYHGGLALQLTSFTDNEIKVVSLSSVPELLKSAPKEVLANLPDTVKRTYAPDQTPQAMGAPGSPHPKR